MKNAKKKDELIRSSAAEYLTYVAATGENGVELRYEDENIWLTQKMLSIIYGVNIATINEHIKNIYKDNELDEDSTIRKFLIVQKEENREVNDNDNKIKLFIDEKILNTDYFRFHPNENKSTIRISMKDFKNKLIPYLKHSVNTL